ncbi:hypothetical protein HA050_03705 [Iodobacter sp. HSC-16F04]|uniref:CdiI immunity protein domain-containing protein n=1 Tax=Iodobacter violaceini TaxID=3044271 RepID=A0ABX0KSB3_9NEIS|nr:hypothetical protein [Iodobacter violacea]NHQ85215.1 hypothetical protein [Iodobacter violacea]
MGMTYIIGINSDNSDELLSVDVNSATDSCISELLSFALEKKHSEIFDKITEQIIFVRFDELTEEEFRVVKKEIDSVILRPDLPENFKLGVHWWLELIKPIMGLDSRNIDVG